MDIIERRNPPIFDIEGIVKTGGHNGFLIGDDSDPRQIKCPVTGKTTAIEKPYVLFINHPRHGKLNFIPDQKYVFGVTICGGFDIRKRENRLHYNLVRYREIDEEEWIYLK